MIKTHLGGNISLISGKKGVRYRLYKQENVAKLIENLNGLIRTPTRIEQFKKACLKHEIIYKAPINLEYDNP